MVPLLSRETGVAKFIETEENGGYQGGGKRGCCCVAKFGLCKTAS